MSNGPSLPTSFCDNKYVFFTCFENLTENSSIDSCFPVPDDFTSNTLTLLPSETKKSTS